jgi:hypothetical protein
VLFDLLDVGVSYIFPGDGSARMQVALTSVDPSSSFFFLLSSFFFLLSFDHEIQHAPQRLTCISG